MSRRRGDVQRDEWRNGYKIMDKVRDIVYDEKSFQQDVSQKITISAIHERRDNDFGASKLLQ